MFEFEAPPLPKIRPDPKWIRAHQKKELKRLTSKELFEFLEAEEGRRRRNGKGLDSIT